VLLDYSSFIAFNTVHLGGKDMLSFDPGINRAGSFPNLCKKGCKGLRGNTEEGEKHQRARVQIAAASNSTWSDGVK
jgi:hypothetical protein